MRRRAAEVARIERWQREGFKFRASIDKSSELVRGLDGEAHDLNCARPSQRPDATGLSILDSGFTPETVESTQQEVLEDRDENEDSDFNFEEDSDEDGMVTSKDGQAHAKESLLRNAVFSDSGYRSGHGSDTESVCSLNSTGNSLGVPLTILQDFIALFGTTLIEKSGARHWGEYTLAHLRYVDVE